MGILPFAEAHEGCYHKATEQVCRALEHKLQKWPAYMLCINEY